MERYEAPEAVEIPIGDELDLHTFRPAEVADLLDEYFRACVAEGIFEVRVIHGKGSGRLKRGVQHCLARNRWVRSWSDAPPEAGGWGATRVILQRPDRSRREP